MKKIGLIGGIGCKSTLLYYNLITNQISSYLGARQSGNIIIYSVNEYDVYQAIIGNRWDIVAEILLSAYQSLEKSGADFIIVCSNTCHKAIETIRPAFKKPLIHILEPVCNEIKKNKYNKIALFGTHFVIEEGFYLDYLRDNAPNLEEIIIPNKKQSDIIHNIIENELLLGIIRNESRNILLDIWENLRNKGANCLLLGCTELSLILSEKNISFPILDSTRLHAIYAVEYAIGGKSADI